MQIKASSGLIILSLLLITNFSSDTALSGSASAQTNTPQPPADPANATAANATAANATAANATAANATAANATAANATAANATALVAEAGDAQIVNESQAVRLDGFASTDPEGDTLTYAWNQTAGPPVTLSNASNSTTTFAAPDVGAGGDTLTFELTVTDNDGANSTDTVNITVNNVAVNQPPEANAGNNQTVNEGNNVTLDGSGTDPEGDTLTYAWNQTAGPSVTLSAADSPTPTFAAPDVGATGDTLTFELTVNDGNGNTATDTVNVNVSADGALVNQNDLINYIFQSSLPALFIIVVFLLIIIPLVLDIILAYWRKPTHSSTNEQNIRPLGIPGLYRSLMAFGIIVLLGTVIFYLLALITLNMNNPSSPAFASLVDLLRNLGIILGTALATIIAFYFGIRGTESAVEKAAAAATAATHAGTAAAGAADVEGPPKILNTRPADGAKNVPTNSLISATFSKPMSSGTINNSTYTVRKDGGSLINGKISLTPDPKTAEFDPDRELDPGTTYIAEISERVKDLAGNAVGSITRWSFTTEERATIPEKPVVTDDKKPVVTDDKKPVVTDDKKPVVTDTGKIEINPENKDKISLPKEIKNAYVLLNGLTGYTIDGIDFSYNGENDMLELTNCVDCKIINCTFHDRTTKGNFIHIRGADSKHNLIENCTFKNHTGEDNNGGEAIIIGLDKWSGCLYETTVRKCEFIKCKGDPEIISIKSVDNVIENNCIRADCDGNITIRHGGRNTIQYNVFEGSAGGIRVLGCGNKIIGNYHNGNDNEKDKRRPLIIQNGDQPKDPNFNDNCEPKKKEGSGAAYAQAENNTIEDNIYDNCKGPCVVWGWRPEDKEDQTYAPKKNTFRNNTLIADKKDSEILKIINAGDGNTFEGNKMYGSKAHPGDLPEGSAKHLGDSVNITVPDTRCTGTTTAAGTDTTTAAGTDTTTAAGTDTTTAAGTDTTTADVDQWGIRKLYKSTSGDNAQEWYFNMENPTSDSRLNNLKRANLKKVDDDGSWSVDGTDNKGEGQVRLEAWSKSPSNRWLNTEVTVYGFYIEDLSKKYNQSDTAFQLYSGGGHHSTTKPCDAGCYKIRLWKNGNVAVRKEPIHPFYCEDRGKNKATEKEVRGRWIGLKQVRYNFEENNKVFVANEIWIDDESDHDGKLDISNHWRRVANVVDKGGWGLAKDMDEDERKKYLKERWHDDCPRMDENVDRRHREHEDILNMPGGTNEGNLAALRCDGIKLKFKYFSVREIIPPKPD